MTQQTTTAEDAVTELEERVREGDTTVTAAQLAEAREVARLAELKAEAADRKAAKDAEAAAEKAKSDAIAEAEQMLDGYDLADLGAKYAAARTTLRELVDAIDARTDTITAAARKMNAAGVPRDRLASVNASYNGARKGSRVKLADRTFDSILPGEVVRRLVFTLAEESKDGLHVPYFGSLRGELRTYKRHPVEDAADALGDTTK